MESFQNKESPESSLASGLQQLASQAGLADIDPANPEVKAFIQRMIAGDFGQADAATPPQENTEGGEVEADELITALDAITQNYSRELRGDHVKDVLIDLGAEELIKRLEALGFTVGGVKEGDSIDKFEVGKDYSIQNFAFGGRSDESRTVAKVRAHRIMKDGKVIRFAEVDVYP